MPNAIPDYGTQLHELSHDFLYFTYAGSEDYPWIKEGSGMYFESGYFDSKGNFKIEKPFPMYHELFKKAKNENRLISLNQLIMMSRNDFYQSDYTLTYSESMIFFYYLMTKQTGTMKELFNKLNKRAITRNEQVIEFIIKSSGKNIDELESEYIKFGMN